MTVDQPAEAITDALAVGYGIDVVDLSELPVGAATVNYIAATADRRYFVKQYDPGTDLAAERNAVRHSAIAAASGVPVPDVVTTCTGDTVFEGAVAMSVWSFVAASHAEVLSVPRASAAGSALARLHDAFDAAYGPGAAGDYKAHVDAEGLARAKSKADVLDGVARAGSDDPAFDLVARETVARRRSQLDRLPVVADGVPDRLVVAVGHGDYSPMNLLYEGEMLRAVVDFRPPDPYYRAYEIGRIAFSPQTVARSTSWAEVARALLHSYVSTSTRCRTRDVEASGRVWLLHLLLSFYGIWEHYMAPRRAYVQADLDQFWVQRQEACDVLVAAISTIDDLVHDAIAS